MSHVAGFNLVGVKIVRWRLNFNWIKPRAAVTGFVKWDTEKVPSNQKN
jgi:hypothetical protein